jgi:hypothetical protein
LNYTSYGYAVTIIGSPPTYGGNPIDAMTTDAASSVGTEQFGVNTVFNPSPVTVGANPAQHATTGVFSYGVAGDGVTGTFGTTRPYTIPSNYRFNSGEVIASAPKSSGQTDYTLSFLANVANLTPSGHYTGSLTLVATGTY